ncbi:MAG: hypothetical protein K2X69_09095 [Silvanigrellaceae bacterium]|nr:hypothetical protein [Silvanigrellaceae bacterium]
METYQKVLTSENAPNCYHLFTICDHMLILETFERIKNNSDLNKGMSQIEIDKIKALVLPALVKDKLIEENNNKFTTLVGGLLFDSNKDKILFIQNHPRFVKNICDKINEKNKNKINIFEYVAKNVSVDDYNDIQNDIKKLKNKILNLKENSSGDTINCEFALVTHFDNN